MKRALILFWHGLGDLIMLTPHLRRLYEKGYRTDLICRHFVEPSGLLAACPYVDKLIGVENPWKSRLGFAKSTAAIYRKFERLRGGYDWSGASPHVLHRTDKTINKIDMTSKELNIDLRDKRLEVFIPKTAEKEASKYMNGDHIFVHTMPEPHLYHAWDATQWIRENLPPLRVINTGYGAEYFEAFDDINTAFVLAREAMYRVLSSSVFVFACEAMSVVIDVVNYGRVDRKCLNVLDQSRILHIREAGKWIR